MVSPEAAHQPNTVETLQLHDKVVMLNLQAQLPQDDSANQLLAEADVTGQAIVDIKAGNQQFIIADISSATDVVGGGKQPFGPRTRVGAQSPKGYQFDPSAPYVLFHFAADGSVTGRAIELGSPILLGRTAHHHDPKSARFPYQGDPSLDTHHLGLVTVHDDGMYKLLVRDESQSGTELRHGVESDEDLQAEHKARQVAELSGLVAISGTDILGGEPVVRGPRVPKYANARAMAPDELWAEVNNGDRTHDIKYIEHYREARNEIVDKFESGELYSSAELFKASLSEIHTFLGRTGDYNRHNGHQLQEGDFGKFREGPASNSRLEGAQDIAKIAYRYGDPYGTDRLWWGPAGTTSKIVVQLPGISPDNLPYDVVHYGKANGAGGIAEQDHYRYYYPDGNRLDEYMQQITLLGQQIEESIKRGNAPVDHILQLVGRQYQYGACARPFVNINNSLFMQFANTQTKLLGLHGMTHGQMDLAAQRMQPHTFARYFAARARGEEK